MNKTQTDDIHVSKLPNNKRGTTINLSIVIPIYEEEENIPELYSRLTDVMQKLGADNKSTSNSYEIIMVNDCSTDDSWRMISEIHVKDPKVKGINFSRNFGHHLALTAGLDCAKGDAVILMDGDLQDPPEEIPKLYQKFNEGYDLVYGIRQQRNDPLLKKMSSYLFWLLLRKLSGVDIPRNQTMLRIMSRRIVDVIKSMKEHARFIHGMMAWAGFPVTTLEVQHNARTKGESKYNISRMFKLALHAITSFSTIPLRIATYIGFASSFFSLIVGLYFIYKKIYYGIPVLGYASIIASIFFVGGVQMLVFGLFGEYLGRVYQQGQKRPLYIIKDYLL